MQDWYVLYTECICLHPTELGSGTIQQPLARNTGRLGRLMLTVKGILRHQFKILLYYYVIKTIFVRCWLPTFINCVVRVFLVLCSVLHRNTIECIKYHLLSYHCFRSRSVLCLETVGKFHKVRESKTYTLDGLRKRIFSQPTPYGLRTTSAGLEVSYRTH